MTELQLPKAGPAKPGGGCRCHYLRRSDFDDDVAGNGYSGLTQRQSRPLALEAPDCEFMLL